MKDVVKHAAAVFRHQTHCMTSLTHSLACLLALVVVIFTNEPFLF